MSQTKKALELIHEELTDMRSMLEAIQLAIGDLSERHKAETAELRARVERLESFTQPTSPPVTTPS